MAEELIVPLVPPIEGPDPELLISVADALRVLEEHPYWKTLISWVNHETVLSNHNGLRDKTMPPDYYAGMGDGMQFVLSAPKMAKEQAQIALDSFKEQEERRARYVSGEGDLA